ncbi:hypothetical protein CRM22_002146 [Opisthorchis felineus]|uniref:Uncharacterized protein n=2 Tax=Opisthorchis felineus TaxID=147828 RepID=A0A4S2MDB6_OPIFE|nr:hypothetical protein CRM22_002146 [Opisthorchis felineus]
MLQQFEYTRNIPDPAVAWSDLLEGSPIIIDNGSFECRAGYAAYTHPHMVFRNFIYRPRMSKTVLVGNDIVEPDAVGHLLKSPFIESLLTGIDVQEHVFDHIFDRLSIHSASVDHPIIVNEILCNPKLCRSQLAELLFETYGIKKLGYYVDALASYHENCSREGITDTGASPFDCLLISFGHQSSHLIPVSSTASEHPVCFQPVLPAARRLNVGGAHVSWLVQRFLQLKYPCHTERITFGLAEHLVHNFGKVLTNYREEMTQWRDPTFRADHTLKIQLPFVQSTMEEFNAAVDRKRAQSIRMQDLHRRRHLDQVDAARVRLNRLLALQDLIQQQTSPEGDSASNLTTAVKRGLARMGLTDYAKLNSEIESIQANVFRLEQQIANIAAPTQPASSTDAQDSSPSDQKTVAANFSSIVQLFENSDGKPLISELSGHLKRATELLQSLSLPAAVQTQMTVAPAPTDSKLSENRLKQRIRIGQELEAARGDDFLAWLISIRHRRQKVAKKRTSRQSRIDLATEIGLHGTFNGTGGPESSNGTGQIKLSGMSGDFDRQEASKETRTVGLTGTGEKGGMTERRRLQLEKIRAMAAELKPTRGRGGKSATLGKSKTRGQSRGRPVRGGTTRGRGSTTATKRSRSTREEPGAAFIDRPTDKELGTMDSAADEIADSWTLEQLEDTDENSTLRVWDMDAEDSNSCPVHLEDSEFSAKSQATATTTAPYRCASDDPGDESENERDQLAVCDCLLALYDPESSKDMGTTDMQIHLNNYYQLQVNTELPRACEVIFQPSFIGTSEAGLSECFEFVLRGVARHYGSAPQAEPKSFWPRRLFLTGGLATLPGLAGRIYTELRSLLPSGPECDNLEILIADDPQLDAWRGARRWATTAPGNIYLARQSYEEFGSDWLVEHAISNRCWNSVVQTL